MSSPHGFVPVGTRVLATVYAPPSVVTEMLTYFATPVNVSVHDGLPSSMQWRAVSTMFEATSVPVHTRPLAPLDV